MRHIGGPMEKVINSVSGIRSDRRAAVCPCNWFAGISQCGSAHRFQCYTHMTFPISRISAPGLQILIDSSRHFLAVRISRSESSSIRPTGYVSFKSPWKPGISDINPRSENDTHSLTVIVQRYVLREIMKNETSMRLVRRTYIDDVALLQLPLVGDPMTNYLVDRTVIKISDPWGLKSSRRKCYSRTNRFRVPSIIQG